MKTVPSLINSSRRRSRPTRCLWIQPALVLFVICSAIAVVCAWSPRPGLSAGASEALQRESLLTVAPVPRVPERLVYRFSVVPGGVGSAAEGQEAVGRDAVVAEHYAQLKLERAHVVDNAAARLVYVSYRKSDRIFWTRNRVRLPAGERLLTDGNLEVRARCGNRVSEKPESPVEPAAEAPPDRALDEPIIADEPQQSPPSFTPVVPESARLDFALSLTPVGGMTLPAVPPAMSQIWWMPDPWLWSTPYAPLMPAAGMPPPLVVFPDSTSTVGADETGEAAAAESEGESEVPESATWIFAVIGLVAIYLSRRAPRNR